MFAQDDKDVGRVIRDYTHLSEGESGSHTEIAAIDPALARLRFDERNGAIQKLVDGLFPDVVKAFRDSDDIAGADLIKREREATRACDLVIDKILEATDLTIRQAVTYTLLARFHKRIAAHLGNIASSLVMPLHKLDYFDEEYLPGRTPSQKA